MSSVLDEVSTIRYQTDILPLKTFSESSIPINNDNHSVNLLTDQDEPSSDVIYGNGRKQFRYRK
jgi:hypothetical protein